MRRRCEEGGGGSETQGSLFELIPNGNQRIVTLSCAGRDPIPVLPHFVTPFLASPGQARLVPHSLRSQVTVTASRSSPWMLLLYPDPFPSRVFLLSPTLSFSVSLVLHSPLVYHPLSSFTYHMGHPIDSSFSQRLSSVLFSNRGRSAWSQVTCA